MAYIGKQPVIGNFVKLDAISVVNGQASYTMQNGGANFTEYANVNQFLVSLNGILQSPTDSFTVSGSTITFASNLVTGDVIDFIIVLGNTLDVGVPSDNTVSLAKLTATGTKDATTFLRGDNTFASAGGDNTPAFFAYLDSDQTISDSVDTKVNINNEVYDTDNCYDNSSNYRFTPTTSGKYLVSANLEIDSGGGVHDINAGYCYLYKNGSEYARARFDPNADVFAFFAGLSVPVVMNGTTDYLEIYTYVDTAGGTQFVKGSSSPVRSWFSAIKIIE
jgi:hypothetical protein